MEKALERAHNLLEVQILDNEALQVRPNMNHEELNKLLGILKDDHVVAIPADKNLGLCIVTSEWYDNVGLQLLQNPSYIEEEPDHWLLRTTMLANILKISEHLLTKQQYKWLTDPIENEVCKVPVLKVIPKIHKLSTYICMTHFPLL